MKRQGINKRVKELCDILKNYEQHKQFFDEIDRDIRKSLEREKKKIEKGMSDNLKSRK